MRKKLQVFISSTYRDLIDERQAAVQAVINAGHIPAGMELFKSGDRSQKETIKRWIDESDVYILILGGRYGTIDNETEKSYTHWEYDYAGEAGKPRFSIVISDEGLNEKVRLNGKDALEINNSGKYEAFKKEVTSKICRFFSDLKDIKLAISEKLPELERDDSLFGWVSIKDIPIIKELLKNEPHELQQRQVNNLIFNGFKYEDVKIVLEENKIYNYVYDTHTSVVKNLLDHKGRLIDGISPRSMHSIDEFIYGELAPILSVYGLVEKNEKNQNYCLTQAGNSFIGLYEIENSRMRRKMDSNINGGKFPSSRQVSVDYINNIGEDQTFAVSKDSSTFVQILKKDLGMDWINGARKNRPQKLNFLMGFPFHFSPSPKPGDQFLACVNDGNRIISYLSAEVEKYYPDRLVKEIVDEDRGNLVDFGFSSEVDLSKYLVRYGNKNVVCITLKNVEYFTKDVSEDKLKLIKYGLHTFEENKTIESPKQYRSKMRLSDVFGEVF